MVQATLFDVLDYAVPCIPRVDIFEDVPMVDVRPQNEAAWLICEALASQYGGYPTALGWVTDVEGAWLWALELKRVGVSVVYCDEVL